MLKQKGEKAFYSATFKLQAFIPQQVKIHRITYRSTRIQRIPNTLPKYLVYYITREFLFKFVKNTLGKFILIIEFQPLLTHAFPREYSRGKVVITWSQIPDKP